MHIAWQMRCSRVTNSFQGGQSSAPYSLCSKCWLWNYSMPLHRHHCNRCPSCTLRIDITQACPAPLSVVFHILLSNATAKPWVRFCLFRG